MYRTWFSKREARATNFLEHFFRNTCLRRNNIDDGEDEEDFWEGTHSSVAKTPFFPLRCRPARDQFELGHLFIIIINHIITITTSTSSTSTSLPSICCLFDKPSAKHFHQVLTSQEVNYSGMMFPLKDSKK